MAKTLVDRAKVLKPSARLLHTARTTEEIALAFAYARGEVSLDAVAQVKGFRNRQYAYMWCGTTLLLAARKGQITENYS